jgi:hypothetical protein
MTISYDSIKQPNSHEKLGRDATYFEEWYRELDSHYTQFDLHETHKYLVTNGKHTDKPIHRWYALKEAYAPELPAWVVNHLEKSSKQPICHIIDPFIGGGTTGISLATAGKSVVGVEYNPFIHMVATAKSQYPELSPDEVKAAVSRINFEVPSAELNVPTLSTLQNERYFASKDLQLILSVLEQVKKVSSKPAIQNFLYIVVASSIDVLDKISSDTGDLTDDFCC